MFDFLKNGRGEILKLFFKNPDREFYFREIAASLNKEPGAIQSYINSLVDQNFLQDERKGNMRFFKLNKNHPLYEEVKSIISKVMGIEYKLRELVSILPKLEYAFIFGPIAKGEEYGDSDIDLLLIGEVDQDFLVEKIVKLQSELSREINYQIYTKDEIVKKLAEKNEFFLNIFSQPIINLKGDHNDFRKLFNL